MENIQLVHRGEDYITISFNYQGEKREVDITEEMAIIAIDTLGKALKKKSFLAK